MWPQDFADWYRWAYPSVYRAVYRSMRRQGESQDSAADLAEEAAQEAARRAAEQIGTPGYFDTREHLRNWMIIVARNYSCDRWKRQREGRLPEGHDQPQRLSAREDRSHPVWDCFVELCEEDRRILDLYYWPDQEELQGRPTDEKIGQILFGRSRATRAALGQRTRRLRLEALARLRECLLRRGIDPGSWNL